MNESLLLDTQTNKKNAAWRRAHHFIIKITIQDLILQCSKLFLSARNIKLLLRNIDFHEAEGYFESNETSTMELFCKNI